MKGASILHESVDVMLSAVFRRRHLKDERDAQQSLLSVAVGYHLKFEKEMSG